MRLKLAAFVGMALLLAVGIGPTPTSAQVSELEAGKMGMETSWKSQIQMPRSGRGLVSAHLWVNKNKNQTFAVAELPNRTLRVSVDALDVFRKPLGPEGAKKKVSEYAARLLGKPDGFTVEMLTVPEVKLVLVNSDGMVQTLDAETGKLLWNTTCGESFAPAFPGAVSESGVSVIHGPNLYVLEWETGKRRGLQRLRSPSSTAVGVCNDLAFVGDVRGQIFGYGIGDAEVEPWSYLLTGRTVGQPVNLANQRFCAVASDAGYVYVFERGDEKPKVWIRYESSAAITGSLAAGNGGFYVGTSNGSLAKVSVETRLGVIKWEYRSGQTTTAPALVAGDSVYATTESGTILAINDVDGSPRWRVDSQNLVQSIATAGNKVFAISNTGELVAVDKATGNEVGRSSSMALSMPIPNQLTDRVYIVNSVGQIQCLRPTSQDLPTFYSAPTPVAPEAGKKPMESGTLGAEQGTDGSPFGGTDLGDPGMGDGGNPFGDAANPFDTGGGDAGDDGMGNPFDGTNPFGG